MYKLKNKLKLKQMDNFFINIYIFSTTQEQKKKEDHFTTFK